MRTGCGHRQELYESLEIASYDYNFGCTCADDVRVRDWQIKRGDSQWCRGKTFDTFAPLGPCVVTNDGISDPHVRIQTILNGDSTQDWKTTDMIFDIPTIIEFLSGSTTLLPGTIILTGTPQGVGLARNPPVFLKSGDKISVVIERIGTLTNPVEEEARLAWRGSIRYPELNSLESGLDESLCFLGDTRPKTASA